MRESVILNYINRFGVLMTLLVFGMIALRACNLQEAHAAQLLPPWANCYDSHLTPIEKRSECIKAAKHEVAGIRAYDACLNRNGLHMGWLSRQIAKVRRGWHCDALRETDLRGVFYAPKD